MKLKVRLLSKASMKIESTRGPMKISVLCISVIIVSTFAHAQQSITVIAHPNPEHSGCDLGVPGIDKAKFLSFFSKLKEAAKLKDPDAMNSLVLFPLRVNSTKGKKQIKDSSEFKKDFSVIFKPKILEAITKQEISNIFCRDQGAMIGNGEIWITQRKGNVGISTINFY